MTEYDFIELKEKALRKEATQEDINRLGEWFEKYGMDCWNGEEYLDEDFTLKPITEPYEDDEEQFRVVGYEIF